MQQRHITRGLRSLCCTDRAYVPTPINFAEKPVHTRRVSIVKAVWEQLQPAACACHALDILKKGRKVLFSYRCSNSSYCIRHFLHTIFIRQVMP